MLIKVLQRMNFGEKTVNWIETIYRDPRSALYINGHIAEMFSTSRGVRQGCPLSAILYVLLAEVLGQVIRKNPKIRGFALPGTNEEVKITQYADDTTFFVSNKTNIDNIFATLTHFETHTGTRIKKKNKRDLPGKRHRPIHKHRYLLERQRRYPYSRN